MSSVIRKAVAELERLSADDLRERLRTLRVEEAGMRPLIRAALARQRERERQAKARQVLA